jgi:hypothetical protein
MSADDTIFDRRELMLAAGAAAAVVYLPFASGSPPAPAAGATARGPLLEDWTIDDMWGVYPRYSEAIGYAPPRDDGERLAAAAAVDAPFVA